MSPQDELHDRLEQRARRRRRLHHQLAQRAEGNGCPRVAAQHRLDAYALRGEWTLDAKDAAELDEARRTEER